MSDLNNKKGNRSLVWTLLAALLSAVAVSVSGVVYTGITTNNNNQKWCELLTTLDGAYKSLPPATELGRKVAESIHKLRNNFEC